VGFGVTKSSMLKILQMVDLVVGQKVNVHFPRVILI